MNLDGPVTDVGERVKLEFYVMSKCPYGVKVMDGIAPALKAFGPNLDFSMDYILSDRTGELKSMHGQPEWDGNVLELCAIKHYPERYMDMISCMNKTWRKIPDNWEACTKEVGFNTDTIRGCFEGSEGNELLLASAAKAKERKASGSPTIFMNDESYRGGRSSSDFIRAICGKFNTKPEICSNLPEPVVVNVTILTDKRCGSKCSTARYESQMKSNFPGMKIVDRLDYNTPEGQALYKELGVKNLPIFLFDRSVEKGEGCDSVKRWLQPKGEKWVMMRVPAEFDPTSEICDNKKDDTGNGKVDCDDETCSGKLICREEIAQKVDLFIMSQCPYGAAAILNMEEVLANFEGRVDFDVHFIGNVNDGKISSMHGQSEVDEDIREICAIKHYPDNYKYMDYLICRSKDYRNTNWEACTGSNDIDTEVIRKCFEGGEGQKLLEEDLSIGNMLGFGGSPSWLVNNKLKFSAGDPESIKQNICKSNKDLAGCENTLTIKNKKRGGGGGGCGG